MAVDAKARDQDMLSEFDLGHIHETRVGPQEMACKRIGHLNQHPLIRILKMEVLAENSTAAVDYLNGSFSLQNSSLGRFRTAPVSQKGTLIGHF